MDFYQKSLADASDFRFFFVGAIDLEATEPLICRYLGSLPSSPGTAASFRDVKIRFPEGVTKTAVYAGTEPKSQTQLTWPALTGLDEYEMFYLRKANDILQIRLREVLREELAGTYSVGVSYAAWTPYPNYGTTTISFGSSPENAEKLAQTVMDEVKKFKDVGPTQEEVDKIKEQEHRGLEKAEKQNSYWLGSFSTLDQLGWEMNRILVRHERIDSITAKKLHEVFSRYYPEDNHTAVTLLPEDLEPKTGNGSR
jgi:zinc protease